MTQLLIGLLGINFLVFIHEAGHFLMALLFKVKVNTFSIGFGKTLWGFHYKGTHYCLKAIPFGGFVAMQGEGDSKALNNKQDFQNKPVWQRVCIALGGPVVNIGFAFICLIFVYQIGIQEPIPSSLWASEIVKNSPAEQAQLKPNDQIIAVNEKPVTSLENFGQSILLQGTKASILKVIRNKKEISLKYTPYFDDNGIPIMGIIPYIKGVQVVSVLPNGSAKNSGIQKDDIIIKINQKPITNLNTFIKSVQNSQGNPISLTIKQEDNILKDIIVIPTKKEDRFYIGIQMKANWQNYQWTKLTLVESIKKSYDKNIENSTLIYRTLTGLIKGGIPLRSMSGPIGAMQSIGFSWTEGIQIFLSFLALISLNLGIFNLLPLAITDGGVIALLIIEAIRKKKLEKNYQLIINQIFFFFFIALFLYITFYDLSRFSLFYP